MNQLAESYLDQGYQVALWGQSMGGATVINVGAMLPQLSGIVSWVPDPNIETFTPGKEGYLEEDGQRVQNKFWQEAYDTKVAQKLRQVQSPLYIVQCANDEYVSAENHQAILDNAQPHHVVEMFDGYTHSSWSYEQAQLVLQKSLDFLVTAFK